MTTRESQLEQLRSLLKSLVPGNDFYSRRLREAGITEPIDSLEDFFKRMPFTLKSELVDDRAEHPPYGSNLTFPLDHYIRFCQTSATSGKPMISLDTRESWNWMLDAWHLVYLNAGVKPGDRLYFAFSFGPFLGFWTAFDSAARLGCLCIPGGGLSSLARLKAINKHQVKFLCCTPTYALHLAEVAVAESIDLSRSAVEKIIVAGEPGGSLPGVRYRVADLWNGAQLFDHYGLTEVGPVAFQDPIRPGILRIIEKSYLAEVVDPRTGRPCKAGDTGELVLTTLGRTAAPVLRYRTGDLVKPVEIQGKEGASLALEGGVFGRSDEMVVVRGVNLYPSAVDNIVRSCPGIGEYRVVLCRSESLSEVSIEAEVETEDGSGELARQLESALESTFLLRIPVTLIERGSLPRFEFKAKRWITR